MTPSISRGATFSPRVLKTSSVRPTNQSRNPSLVRAEQVAGVQEPILGEVARAERPRPSRRAGASSRASPRSRGRRARRPRPAAARWPSAVSTKASMFGMAVPTEPALSSSSVGIEVGHPGALGQAVHAEQARSGRTRPEPGDVRARAARRPRSSGSGSTTGRGRRDWWPLQDRREHRRHARAARSRDGRRSGP